MKRRYKYSWVPGEPPIITDEYYSDEGDFLLNITDLFMYGVPSYYEVIIDVTDEQTDDLQGFPICAS